jgi:hypothetical protein
MQGSCPFSAARSEDLITLPAYTFESRSDDA